MHLLLRNRMFIWVLLCLALIFSFTYIIWNLNLSPAETITKFHHAAKKGDITELKKYISKDQFELIPYVIRKQNEGYEKVHPLEQTQKINGDIAELEVEINWTNHRVANKKHYLLKEDGDWKIYKIQDLF